MDYDFPFRKGNFIIPTDSYFSEGLKPPTRFIIFSEGLKPPTRYTLYNYPCACLSIIYLSVCRSDRSVSLSF